MDPALHGSNDAVGVSGPDEGLGIGIGLGEEAVDGGLEFDDGSEYAALQPAPGQSREQRLDRIEPGARFRGEVEDEPRVPRQLGLHLGMFLCVA